MIDLFAQIEDRAGSTPRMTAVRLAGEPVTYHALAGKIADYRPVVEAQGMSLHAALAAALMSLLPPQLRGLAPDEQGQWVAAAMRWLTAGPADLGSPLEHAV